MNSVHGGGAYLVEKGFYQCMGRGSQLVENYSQWKGYLRCIEMDELLQMQQSGHPPAHDHTLHTYRRSRYTINESSCLSIPLINT